MHTILVTGGCGFIGSNFIKRLLCKDTSVKIINLDKLTYSGNIENLTNLKNKNYKMLQGDICDTQLIKSLFNNYQFDAVVHFAAESHVDRSIDDPNQFLNTNVMGTLALLNGSINYLKKTKKQYFRFLHISTDEVYGSLKNSGKFLENTPYDPSSPYSASKASSDHLVRAWQRTYDLPTLITNCSNNYGPFQFPEKLIPLMIINCLDNKQLPIYGKGDNIRDWLYVNDHCDALIRVLKRGKVGETYNIGGENELKNIDVVNKICEILDNEIPLDNGQSYKQQIRFVTDRPGHDFRYAIDASKIKTELGWSPKESFSSGLYKTIKWYLNNEDWWRAIQKKEYNQQRLGVLKQ